MTALRRLAGPLLAATLAVPVASAGAAEAPRVIASIKPIHSLAAAVMAGVGVPELLVQWLDSTRRVRTPSFQAT